MNEVPAVAGLFLSALQRRTTGFGRWFFSYSGLASAQWLGKRPGHLSGDHSAQDGTAGGALGGEEGKLSGHRGAEVAQRLG